MGSLLLLLPFLLPFLLLSLSATAHSSSVHLLIDGNVPDSDEAAPPPVYPLAPYPSAPSPLVPALFVIGDSTVDCGTNNYLGTLARADRPPYGRDFDTHQATGRFCNGRIIVDYLALRLGLPFVPPFLGRSSEVKDMIQGVNYASAASGIIFSSGSDLGMHVSLSQQMEQVMDTFQHFELDLGKEAADNLISESVFYLSIGSNDFIHYFLENVSDVQSRYLPWEFAQLLIGTVEQHLENLYVSGVRKVVVMGLAPLGCAPHYLWLYGSKKGECVDEINNLVIELNFGMRYMVDHLNHELLGADMIFCDGFEGSMDMLTNRDHYGFETTTDACCGFGKYGGWLLCLTPEMACSNASSHVWWDEFHPTDTVNKILADNVWSGVHANMCYPRNLKDMIP